VGRPAEAHRLRLIPDCAGQPENFPGWPFQYKSVTLPYPLARESHGIRYNLIAPPDTGEAHFTFSGRFQNQEIVWDATLITLAHFHAQQPQSIQATVRSAFLEIGDETEYGRALRVALDIPRIDEPAILRTIIMVRNYKRLHPGRHEFGEPRMFLPHAAG
jgi:hypothetical protein